MLMRSHAIEIGHSSALGLVEHYSRGNYTRFIRRVSRNSVSTFLWSGYETAGDIAALCEPGFGICSARLQAGTLESSTCPPEGGRYITIGFHYEYRCEYTPPKGSRARTPM